jgi:Ca2+-binding RTX toxin-like protein
MKPTAKPRQVRTRLGLETLEDRLVPSAVSIDPTSRVLTYQADSNETNSLQISHQVTPKVDRYVFTETGGIGIRDGSGGTFTTVRIDSTTFDSIVVKVDDKADTVTVLTSDKAIDIYGGKGNDTFIVRATSQPINVYGEDGNDSATIGGTTGRGIEDITANVAFDGGTQTANGQDKLIINDRDAPVIGPPLTRTHLDYFDASGTVARQRMSFTGSSLSLVRMVGSDVESEVLKTSSQPDTIGVSGTLTGTQVEIDAGNGNDQISVDNMDLLEGSLNLQGEGGSDAVTIDDRLSAIGHNYVINSTKVSQGSTTVTMGGMEGMTIEAPNQVNTFTVQSMNAPMPLNLVGNTESDTVIIDDSGASATTTYTLDAGKVVRSLASTLPVVTGTVNHAAIDKVTINAGKGADTFQIIDTDQPVLELNGNGGTDTLDYTKFTSDVLVNLAMGNATKVSKVSNVENVFGGKGDDVLVGNSGANLLKGFGGNDVLIGEGGADVIRGGAGEDLMVDGSTDYDIGPDSASFLGSIRDAWADTATPVGDRVTSIKIGVGLNHSIKLDSTTVHSDTSRDQLFGNDDGKTQKSDWFWANSTQDKMTSLKGEIFE